MRVLAAFIIVALSVPTTAADDSNAVPKEMAPRVRSMMADPRCAPTRSYVADTGSTYRGQKLMPKKLTELPPGTTYMAVFRHIDGCEAPMTMVEYRNPKRR